MKEAIEAKEAIQVILSDKEKYSTSLNYAVSYCTAALSMNEEDLKVQVLYILVNIIHWIHPEAKEIRKILKSYGGVK